MRRASRIRSPRMLHTFSAELYAVVFPARTLRAGTTTSTTQPSCLSRALSRHSTWIICARASAHLHLPSRFIHWAYRTAQYEAIRRTRGELSRCHSVLSAGGLSGNYGERKVVTTIKLGRADKLSSASRVLWSRASASDPNDAAPLRIRLSETAHFDPLISELSSQTIT